MDAANEESPWADEASLPESFKHQICIERFHGPIFFGSITGFNKVMHQVPEEAKVVILRMKRVKYMDQSGVYAMEAAVKELQERGILVLMTIIQKMDFIPDVVKKEHTFDTFEECTEFLKKLDIFA